MKLSNINNLLPKSFILLSVNFSGNSTYLEHNHSIYFLFLVISTDNNLENILLSTLPDCKNTFLAFVSDSFNKSFNFIILLIPIFININIMKNNLIVKKKILLFVCFLPPHKIKNKYCLNH